MKKLLTITALVFGVSFLINLFWENAQAPLYPPYTGLADHFLVCFRATVGDALYLSAFYLILAAINRDLLWWRKRSPVNIILLIAIASIVAAMIEIHALATGRWAYSESMPLVPILGVGLLPFVQLWVTSLLTYYLVDKALKWQRI